MIANKMHYEPLSVPFQASLYASDGYLAHGGHDATNVYFFSLFALTS